MFHNPMKLRYSNTMDSIVRFKNQDFESLRNYCLRTGKLFEDNTFPANDSAIGQRLLNEKNIPSPEWWRPKDLLGTSFPHFILDGFSKFYIQQGIAGDCWFIATLGSLTHKPELLAKIVPTNQSFTQGYAGIFHFQFWQCGQWVDVVVDDRLPMKPITRDYLFVFPRGRNYEFWPCLVEKAYAKFHGSYSHLHRGFSVDSLVELSGWVVTKITDFHPNLVKTLKVAEQSGSLITCEIARSSDNLRHLGLVNNHAYTITGSAEVHLDTGREKLIRLWNPWGWCSKVWLGRWSDKGGNSSKDQSNDLPGFTQNVSEAGYKLRSSLYHVYYQSNRSVEWQRVQEPERTKLNKNKDDGEFWISFQDFQKIFSSIFICYKHPIIMENGALNNGIWIHPLNEVQNIQKKYMPEISSDAIGNTLQYIFSVTEPTEGINVVVSINIQPNPKMMKMAGFKVYKDFYNALNPMYFVQFRSPIQGKFDMSQWNYTESFQLVPGTYVVVPMTSEAREVKFFLRIYVKHQDVNKKLHGNFKFTNFKENLPKIQYHERIFNRYTQQGPEIDSSQLQRLLNQELLKSYSSESLERKFTFDESRSILALMDVKVNGQLDLQEFGQLWKKLTQCQDILRKVEKNGSGFIMCSDLWKVIKEAESFLGSTIDSDLLDLMVIRYGDGTGKFYFSDMICFLLRLQIMTKAFQNLSKDGRGLYLTKNEWIKFTMYC